MCGSSIPSRQAADVMSRDLGPGAVWMVEEMVDFRQEIAVQVARSLHGQAVAYPPVRTVQVDGICVEGGPGRTSQCVECPG